MQKLTIAVVTISIAILTPWLNAGTKSGEEAAVRQAIEHYFQGHATGKAEHFRKVFHPASSLFYLSDGTLRQRTSAEYIAAAKGSPHDDEAGRKRRIISVDITGDIAMAKLELDYPSALITDYMSMIKVDGEWKIINKVFHVDRRSQK